MSLRIAARILDNARSALFEGRECIEPLIRARRADMERFGPNWQDRPVGIPYTLSLEAYSSDSQVDW